MDDNEARHSILEDILFMIHDVNKDPLTTVIEFQTLIDYKESPNKTQRQKALKYLLATGFLSYLKEGQLHTCVITQKGIDAFNSEYFLSVHTEDIKKRNNNRWMIGTNVVLALGVIYSIFHDNFSYSKRDSGKISSKIEQTNKKEDSLSIQKKTCHVSTLAGAKDSLKISP